VPPLFKDPAAARHVGLPVRGDHVRSVKGLGLVAAADRFHGYQFLVLSTGITLASELVNPRHGHHVAGGEGEGVEHFEKLAPVAMRTGRLKSSCSPLHVAAQVAGRNVCPYC
jgi:hypothetical protein